MTKDKIVTELQGIIKKQGRYYAFRTHTKPLLEGLIDQINTG